MFYVPDFLLTSPNQKIYILYRTKNTRNMTYYNIKKGKKKYVLEGGLGGGMREGFEQRVQKKTIPLSNMYCIFLAHTIFK